MPKHVATAFALFSFTTLLLPTLVRSDERRLSTDRPARTESPYSVPAGWFQVENDLVSWGRIETIDETVTGTSILPFNAKYGVTRKLDVQFLFTPWVGVRTESTGLPADETSGTGQAGLRVKFNVTGNDRGKSALAVLPFAYVPTRGDAIFDSITWGMVAPVVINLGGGGAMNAMGGVMRLNNADTWVIGSISLGTPIAGDVAGFLEVYVARAGFEQDALSDVTLDAGVIFAPDPDWQFDAGVYRGVTSDSEDWRVFVGASARFDLSPQ